MKIGATTAPVAASVLELESTTQGFVLPRVSLVNITSNSPLGATILTSTIVYNTNAAVVGGSGAGIYYWDGTKWNFIANSTTVGNYWSIIGNAGTTSATNFLGTTDNNGVAFRTNNVQRMLIDSLGDVAIGSTAYDPINRERLLVDYGSTTSNTIANFRGNAPTYFQINLQNTNSSSNSSTDFVATNDIGTDSTYYIDMGINSSTYAPSVDNFGGPNDGYLFINARNLVMGTQSSNSDIIFLNSGGSTRQNQTMRLDGSTGNVIIGKDENISLAPVGNTLRAPNAGANSPANSAGGTLTILGGTGVGTGSGGSVLINGGTAVSGTYGPVSLNASSNGATNINTGTSTGTTSIGNSLNNILLPGFPTIGGVFYTSAASGQIASTGTGTAGYILQTNGTGLAPTWVSVGSATSATDWQLLGNTGITQPAAPATYGTSTFAAGENWIGTTDAKDFTIGTSDIERMRVLSSGYVGIGTSTPNRSLVVQGNHTNNVITIENTNVAGYSSMDMYSNTGTLSATFGYGNASAVAPYTGRGYFNSYSTDFIWMNNAVGATTPVMLISGQAATPGYVGIGTSTPARRLEIGGTTNTVRIDGLATGGTFNSSSTAASSTLVYSNNTTGDLYALPTANSSVLITNSTGVPSWNTAITNGLFWSLTGNSGITQPAAPATYGTSTFAATENWIGTTDVKDVTIGSSNKERMRILSTGNIGIGTAAPAATLDINGYNVTTGNVVNVNGNTVTSGNGLNLTANALTQGYGLNVSSTSTAGTANGSTALINISRSGANANAGHTAYGIYSNITNTNAGSGTDIGGYFSASGATTNNYGVNGVSSSAAGYGVVGTNTAASGTGAGTGVYGSTSQASGYGVYGVNTSTSVGNSIGVYGVKSGATGTGTGYGIYGSATGTATTNYGGYFTASGGTANYGVVVPSTGGNSGFGTTTPAQEIEVGPTTKTIRIDGLQSGGTYNSSSTVATSAILYANNLGDIYSLPTANSSVLITSATGVPSWSSATTNGLFWSLIGNTGITQPAAPATYGTSTFAAGENWIGTTDVKDVTIGSSNKERMRILSTGNIGIGTAAPAQSLEVGYTTGTVRVDGLKSGNSYNSSSTAASSTIVYSNNTTGDLYALPTANSSVLITNSTGVPSWNTAITNGLFWSLTGNSGITQPAAPATYGTSTFAAGENWIGTTDVKDVTIGSSNKERMRILSTGNIGIGTAAPAATLDINGYNVTTGNVVNVNGNTVTSGNGLNLTANALTQGYGLNVSSISTAGTANGSTALINISRSGANANAGHTAYGIYSNITNTNAGSGTNIGGYFSASGATTNNYGVNGVSSSAAGYGVVGTNTAASGTGAGTGVYGSTSQASGYGVYGTNTSTSVGSSIGVYGVKSGATGTGTGYGIYGSATGTATTNYGGYFTASGGTANYGVVVPSTGGNSGFGTTTPAQEIEVGGTTNTSRIDGIAAGGTYNSSSTVATSAILYANNLGDIYSLPTANSSVLITSATGVPSWSSATTNGLFWSLIGNTGITQPAAPATYGTSTFAAGENWIGTTDAKDLTIGTSNIERMRVLSTGYVGIGTSTPNRPLVINGNSTNNVATIQNTNVAGYSSIDMYSNTGTLSTTFGYGNASAVAPYTGRGYFNSYSTDFIWMNNAVGATTPVMLISGQAATPGYVGIGTSTPARRLEIGGTTNTVRIDGLATGGTFNSSSTAASSTIVYSNNTTGDLYALPTANSSVLITNSTGVPSWNTAITNGLFWSLTGNSGITQPAAPATYGTSTFAATENWIGTTDVKDVTIGSSNKERMRILSTGNIGIGTAAPAATLDINGYNVTTGNVVNVNGNTVTSGNGLNLTANALTQGYGLNVSSTSTAGTANGSTALINISRSGANANAGHTAYGIYSNITNTNAGSGTDIGGYFSASGATTNNYGVNGVSSSAAGYGVVGTNTAASGTGAGTGVYGSTSQASGYGVYGVNTSTSVGNSIGVYGVKSGATGTGTGYGIYGSATGTATTNYGGYFTASGGTANYGVVVPSTGGNSGFGTTTPAQEIEVGPTTKTIRIDGLQSGGTYNSSSTVATSAILYANNLGDIYSLPTANSSVLITSATGVPSWSSATTNGLFWSLIGNTGITQPAAPATYGTSTFAAGENWIGTTDVKDVTIGSSNKERMRILSTGNIGIGTAAPAQSLEVGYTTGTVRVDGLKSGNSYNSSSTAASSTIVYSNNTTGDLYALPTANSSVLITNSTGVPSWNTAITNGLFWSLTGNSGITQPAAPATYGTSTFAATENWIGTTDVKDLTIGTSNIERMRVLSSGYVGIGTSTPNRALVVQGNNTNNVITIENTNAAGYSSVDMYNNSGTLSSTFGYGNPSAGAPYTARGYFNTYSNDFVWMNNGGGATTPVVLISAQAATPGYVGIATTTPARKLEIGGTANTVRIDGLASGSTFNSSSTATTSTMVYSNNSTGDLYSLPTANSSVLITSATGVPSWTTAITNGLFWSLTGNSGTTVSTSAIGTAANNNFIGTTDNSDLVIATDNFERLHINNTGNIGIQTTNPSALLDINTSAAANAFNVTTGNVVNVTANSLTTGTALNINTTGTITGTGSLATLTGNSLTSGYGIDLSVNAMNTGNGIYETANALTTGNGMAVSSSSAGITTGSLLSLSSTGVISNASGSLLNIKSTATNTAGYLATIVGNSSTTGGIMNISGTGLTTGIGLTVSVSGTGGISSTTTSATAGSYGVLGSNSNATGYGTEGINSNAAGIGVYGRNSAATGTGAGYGVYGTTLQSAGAGVYGIDNNSTSNQTGLTGVYGTYNTTGNGSGVTGIGGSGVNAYTGQAYDIGVYGSAGTYGVWGNNTASTASTIGVYGTVSYAGVSGTYYPAGLEGVSTAAAGTGGASGVIGTSNQSNGYGVWGLNFYNSNAGVGVAGTQFANAGTPLILSPAGGSGGSFTGNGTNATGKVIIGVAGYANSGTTSASGSASTTYFAGGYFASGISAAGAASYYAYVGAINNGTNYKIIGTGTVSTIVRNEQNKKVTMYAPEATEILLEDYGSGKLVNGKIHIDLDPTFAKNIAVNEKHALRVMITLNDQCNGVFVANRTKTGFDVVELNNGNSSAEFTYQVVANRADEYDTDGKTLLSKNQDLRFSDAPEAAPSSATTIKK